MKQAEFDWRLVVSAVIGADLSDQFDENGLPHQDPSPAWPSKHYRDLHRELKHRIIAPPRQPARKFGITLDELERAVDALFNELARAEPPDPVIAGRWEDAGRNLMEAKRLARKTVGSPSFFD